MGLGFTPWDGWSVRAWDPVAGLSESRGFGLPQSGVPPWHRWPLFFPQCFRKYLTPEERADVIMVAMEAMASARRNDGCAASKILETLLKYPLPALGKVAARSGWMAAGNSRTLLFVLFLDLVLFPAEWGVRNQHPFTHTDEKRSNEETFCNWEESPSMGRGAHIVSISTRKGRRIRSGHPSCVQTARDAWGCLLPSGGRLHRQGPSTRVSLLYGNFRGIDTDEMEGRDSSVRGGAGSQEN